MSTLRVKEKLIRMKRYLKKILRFLNRLAPIRSFLTLYYHCVLYLLKLYFKNNPYIEEMYLTHDIENIYPGESDFDIGVWVKEGFWQEDISVIRSLFQKFKSFNRVFFILDLKSITFFTSDDVKVISQNGDGLYLPYLHQPSKWIGILYGKKSPFHNVNFEKKLDDNLFNLIQKNVFKSLLWPEQVGYYRREYKALSKLISVIDGKEREELKKRIDLLHHADFYDSSYKLSTNLIISSLRLLNEQAANETDDVKVRGELIYQNKDIGLDVYKNAKILSYKVKEELTRSDFEYYCICHNPNTIDAVISDLRVLLKGITSKILIFTPKLYSLYINELLGFGTCQLMTLNNKISDAKLEDKVKRESLTEKIEFFIKTLEDRDYHSYKRFLLEYSFFYFYLQDKLESFELTKVTEKVLESDLEGKDTLVEILTDKVDKEIFFKNYDQFKTFQLKLLRSIN